MDEWFLWKEDSRLPEQGEMKTTDGTGFGITCPIRASLGVR
jgi:hypothetical protein